MKFVSWIGVIIISLISVFVTCKGKKGKHPQDPPKVNQQVNMENDFWHALVTNDKNVCIAGRMGTLLSLSLDDTARQSKKTSLDNPYLLMTNEYLFAIGIWNTTPLFWKIGEEQLIKHNNLFSGRVTAVAEYDNIIYVAGANKDTVNTPAVKKDNVLLLPGEIYRIRKDKKEKVGAEVAGLVVQMVAGKSGYLAWVDDAQRNKITILDSDGNIREVFTNSGDVTAMFMENQTLFYATLGVVEGINLIDEERLSPFDLGKDALSILKILKNNDKLYLFTSEGIIEMPGGKKINQHDGQAHDMVLYRDGILSLWSGGILEYYQPDQSLRTYTLTQ